MSNRTVTCIVPFYNEGERLNDVISELAKVNNIDEIICVDDCSQTRFRVHDSWFRVRKKNKIHFVRLKKHSGKAQTIQNGLKQGKGEYIFLCDADVRGLKHEEIEKAIGTMIGNPTIDMILLSRVNAKLESKWIRADTIFSGERILKRKDLVEVFKMNPHGYQIEIAINKYMMDRKKSVFWMPSSGVNTFKRNKLGSWLQGTIKEQEMHLNMMKFVGFFNYWKQVFFFCRNQA